MIDFQDAATVVGLIMTGIGLIYAGIQLRAAKKIARGEFLLRLDEMFQQHLEVHTRLRPGGVWAVQGKGPSSLEDWVAVEKYMGLFERIKVLIDDGIVDLATIDRLYGYRVFNIVANEVIRKAKLEGETRKYWQDFIGLHQSLEKRRRKFSNKRPM
jgi:hypothetical protein